MPFTAMANTDPSALTAPLLPKMLATMVPSTPLGGCIPIYVPTPINPTPTKKAAKLNTYTDVYDRCEAPTMGEKNSSNTESVLMEDERVWSSTWPATLSKTAFASVRRALRYRRGWYQ